MTNAEFKKIESRKELLTKRCQALMEMEQTPIVQDIIAEYTQEVDRLHYTLANRREYLYNFVSGGWNSEYAFTLEQAIEQAEARWAGKDGLDLDKKSFRVSTPADYQNLLSLFH